MLHLHPHHRLFVAITRRLISAMAAVCIGAPIAGAQNQPELTAKVLDDHTVDRAALHLPGATWNTTVNGMAFQQSPVVSYNGWQYVTWWDADRRLCVARNQLGADRWETIRFEDYRFKGNDTHNVTVVGICRRDGTVHLAFDHHGHPLRYRASRAGAASRPDKTPWNAELFGPVTDELRPGEPIRGVTYPRFLMTPAGTLQFVFRVGGSGNGDSMMTEYDPERGGWASPRVMISREGVYGSSRSRNAYLNGLTYGGNRLHLSWCWRESGDAMRNHDLCYAYSDDGGRTWRGEGDQAVAVFGERPMHVGSAGIRAARIDMYRGLANSTTQDVDAQGNFHAATFHLPDSEPSHMDWAGTRKHIEYFHYWRDAGGVWRRNATGERGTRPQLFMDRHSNAYLVFTGDLYLPDERDLVMIAARAADQWRTWKRVLEIPGPFTGQPQIDRRRGENVFAVYIQEYPDNTQARQSALRVIEIRTGQDAARP